MAIDSGRTMNAMVGSRDVIVIVVGVVIVIIMRIVLLISHISRVEVVLSRFNTFCFSERTTP